MLSEKLREKEYQVALDAVLASNTFMRSERLKRFLTFVCELVIAGQGEEINEHLIGIEVFDRQAGYSPGEDSIVRRQAHALRKKLEEYYRGEGKDARIRIELPLGHYAAAFRIIDDNVAAIAPVEPPLQPSRRKQWAAVAACLLLFGGGFLSGRVLQT